MEKRNRKVQYLIALSVSTMTLTMGIVSAWPTPVIPKFHANETSVEINKHEIAWMLSMGSPGFIVGSLVTGVIMDRVGRRATLLLSALPYGLGMIIVATARNSWMLYITHFLWQFATGMLSITMTLYFGEISDKDIRGTLSLLTRISFNLGNLLMMCIGPFLSYETLNWMLLALPIMYLIVCWWIPESPYYYLKDGRVDAAKKVLVKLRGHVNEKALTDELSQLQCQVKSEMCRSSSPKELYTGKQYRKAIIIAVGLKTTQIMTGLMTVQQYLALIMQESGIHLSLSAVIIAFGVIRFFVSIMPSVLADKVGRRPLLIYSYFGTGISLATVGLYFFCLEILKVDETALSKYGFISFAGIILSNIISTVGFSSIVTVIPGEIFPMNVKAAAMSSLGIFGGVLGFIISRSYQALKDVIGLCGVFWIFAAIAFSGAVFSLAFVPETKGKSLDEIQKQLQGHLYNSGCENGVMKLNKNENCVNDKMQEVQELEVLNKKE